MFMVFQSFHPIVIAASGGGEAEGGLGGRPSDGT
jgi:hypothetical protein